MGVIFFFVLSVGFYLLLVLLLRKNICSRQLIIYILNIIIFLLVISVYIVWFWVLRTCIATSVGIYIYIYLFRTGER